MNGGESPGCSGRGQVENLMSWDQAQLSLCVSLGKGLPIFIHSVVFLMKSGDTNKIL